MSFGDLDLLSLISSRLLLLLPLLTDLDRLLLLLYFEYDDYQLGKSLARCSTTRCEPSAPLVSGLNGWSAVAIDDRFIYVATTEQETNPDQQWDFPSATIRRLAK